MKSESILNLQIQINELEGDNKDRKLKPRSMKTQNFNQTNPLTKD